MGVKASAGYKKTSRSSSSTSNVVFVPAGGISVRFLTGSEGWVEYKEFWLDGKPIILTEENEDLIPEGKWPSTLYLAAALDTANNRVVAIKLKKSLADKIVSMEEKYFDKKGWELTDYDLELSKEGSGMDTTYNALYEGAEKVDVSRYEVPNLFEILTALITPAKAEADESDIDDDDSDDEPKVTKKFVARKG